MTGLLHGRNDLRLADCREVLRSLPDCSVHVVVTDPPYEIGMMGSKWDSTGIAFDRELWTEMLRVLTPGAHVFAFGAPKTWHWLACAMELAGFEPRDSIAWIQGEGMAHGANIGKRIDKEAGAVRDTPTNADWTSRPVDGRTVGKCSGCGRTNGGQPGNCQCDKRGTPATPEAAKWEGWNTTLAPKHEPIVVMRKPIERGLTEAANVLKWGTGALNIDACRLPGGKRTPYGDREPVATTGRGAVYGSGHGGYPLGSGHDAQIGRWPPNVALDEAAAAELRARVGTRTSGAHSGGSYAKGRDGSHGAPDVRHHDVAPASTHGPDAFFFCPKAPTGERDRGCEQIGRASCRERVSSPV